MNTTSLDSPMSPCRDDGTPAGVPPSAGTFMPEPPSPEKPETPTRKRPGRGENWRERREISHFKTQDEAGRMLGKSAQWLWRMAQRHELYKPTYGGGKQGATCHYHVLHIKHIENYLLTHSIGISEDDALASWKGKLQEIASEMQASLRPPAPTRGRQAKKGD